MLALLYWFRADRVPKLVPKKWKESDLESVWRQESQRPLSSDTSTFTRLHLVLKGNLWIIYRALCLIYHRLSAQRRMNVRAQPPWWAQLGRSHAFFAFSYQAAWRWKRLPTWLWQATSALKINLKTFFLYCNLQLASNKVCGPDGSSYSQFSQLQVEQAR